MIINTGEDLRGVHAAFAETDYGKALGDKVRYERYKPVRVDNERWVQLLGADVNNLTHLALTFGLAKSFIKSMNELDPSALTEHDETLLLIAALVHDWAEAIVGDITYSNKTQVDTDEEKRQFTVNLSGFYSGESDDIKELIVLARDEVVFSPESRLGKMFNAIERVGYVRTALRANDHIKDGTAPDCEDGLRWLVVDVFSNHPATLTTIASELQPVKEYLLAQHEAISTAYEMIDSSVFDNYGGEAAKKKAMVAESHQLWGEWLATLGL